MRLGCLYGVGVGPGDPELLTLKACRVLREAAVVVVPKRGPRDEGYAFGIVRHLLDPARQEVLELVFPMTRDRRRLERAWEDHAATVAARLQAGRDCAFITEGDPFFYSTFIYIWERLRRCLPGLRAEVIPGVSSVHAAACRAGVPLACGDERVAVLPGVGDAEEVRRHLAHFETVVFLKCHSGLPTLLSVLEAEGLEGSAVYVKKATAPEEEVVADLRDLAGRDAEYLSLVIVRRPAAPGVSHHGGAGAAGLAEGGGAAGLAEGAGRADGAGLGGAAGVAGA